MASTIRVADLASRQPSIATHLQGIEVFALVGLFYIFLSLPVAWLAFRGQLSSGAKVAR